MTIKEYRTLKDGDIIRHKNTGEVSIIDSEETKHGFFHRPVGSRGGWDTVNETNCGYYEKAE